MTQKQNANVLRGKYWKSDPEFDNLIRDLKPSGLEFLKQKYLDDLDDYSRIGIQNLNKNEFEEYQLKKQRYKRICEESEKRYHDTLTLDNKDYHFSDNYDYVINESKDGTIDAWDIGLTEYGIEIKKRNSEDK